MSEACFGYLAGATGAIGFTASRDGGVIYKSHPAGQYNPTVKQGGAAPPALGHERNGVFFQ